MSFPFPNGVRGSSLPSLPPPPIMVPGGGDPFEGFEGFGAMPGMNDAPLEFTTHKGCPGADGDIPSDEDAPPGRTDIKRRRNREREREKERDRYERRSFKNRPRSVRSRSDSSDASGDNRQAEDIIPDPQPGGMIYGGMGMAGMYGGGMIGTPMGMVGGMGNMMVDPSMMGISQYAMIDNPNVSDPNPLSGIPMGGANGMPMNASNPMPMVDGMPSPIGGLIGLNGLPVAPVKETIHLKSCTLIPPYPTAPPPPTRDRPPGCRTVFVGGLPENVTEEILTEIFERCGQITSLRLSKKNFCHIRFVFEQSVDGALYLSGYRIRIDNKTDPANCARIHVDFAHARDDKYEWECKQRAMQRAARHMERQTAPHDPPSPPPIHHYTDHEAAAICEKIKQDENFIQAVQVLITWLERGDCTKKNVNVFYSMIQSTNSHVRRLLSEKTQYDEEIQRAKDEARRKMQGILNQFSQVEKVFKAASHKKVWDHFTKAQRKNIDMWKKQSSEIRCVQLEDFLQESCGGEEMDCSDTDEADTVARKRPKIDSESIREENDSLRCQLEAYRNEVEVLKSETQSEIDGKNVEINEMKAQITALEGQLAQAKRAQASETVKLLAMEAKFHAQEKLNTNDKLTFDSNKPSDSINAESNDKGDSNDQSRFVANLTDREAKLIGIISTFLHVHPFGASTDYVWSYVQKMEPQLTPNQVEDLLRKYPTVFIQEMSGVGANIERKWVFNGFTNSH